MAFYRHILLALDDSETSCDIAIKAVALADQQEARLSVVHVLDNIAMPDTGYGSVIPLDDSCREPELEMEKNKFKKRLDELGLDLDNSWMIWGNPRQEIVELADKLVVDLIVLGSHGHHGLQALLGSTANAVLHHARCDVLALRIR